MRKWFLVMVAVGVLLAVTGCMGQKDALVYHAPQENLSQQEQLSFDVALGNKVRGADVTVEYWMSGQLIHQELLQIDALTNHFSAVFDVMLEMHRLDLQFNSDSLDEAHRNEWRCQWELPETVCGYTFESFEDQEKIVLHPTDELILGGIAFDLGDGVLGIDKKGLIEEPERINDYHCMVIIRARFEGA